MATSHYTVEQPTDTVAFRTRGHGPRAHPGLKYLISARHCNKTIQAHINTALQTWHASRFRNCPSFARAITKPCIDEGKGERKKKQKNTSPIYLCYATSLA